METPERVQKTQSARSGGNTPIGKPDPERNGHPWEDNGGLAVKSMPLEDIDHDDKRFQLRLSSASRAELRRSLASSGQREPIKVMPGKTGYVIIDGHSRVAEIGGLGWTHVKVSIYPLMSDQEAMLLAWQSNSVRKNLSALELANLGHRLVKSGLTRNEVAKLLDRDRRTIDRDLKIPEDILDLVDGEVVNLAHAEALADVRDQLSDATLQEWVEQIRSNRWTKAQVVKQLRREGLKPGAGGRPKRFCQVTENEIRFYPTRITNRSSTADLTQAVAQLRAALAKVEAILGAEDGSVDEN